MFTSGHTCVPVYHDLAKTITIRKLGGAAGGELTGFAVDVVDRVDRVDS